MIRLDTSAETVVAICTACHFREIDVDRGRVWRIALAHIQSVHPDDAKAIEAASRSTRNNTPPRPHP